MSTSAFFSGSCIILCTYLFCKFRCRSIWNVPSISYAFFLIRIIGIFFQINLQLRLKIFQLLIICRFFKFSPVFRFKSSCNFSSWLFIQSIQSCRCNSYVIVVSFSSLLSRHFQQFDSLYFLALSQSITCSLLPTKILSNLFISARSVPI